MAGGEEQVFWEEREQAKGNPWVRASHRFMQRGLVFLLLLAEKSEFQCLSCSLGKFRAMHTVVVVK